MNAKIIVAGHICLDIIPTFEQTAATLGELLKPGRLVKVGPAVFATGGAVANTGIALHRLGIPVRLMGKVGRDIVGQTILKTLAAVDPILMERMIVDPGAASSYTVVISPPGIDRLFLHCTGANDTFRAADIDYGRLAGAKLFHFGYPTLMRNIYADGGAEMETIFRRVKELGLITSLDMSMPDMQSEAGRVDWTAWLQRVLPHVDIFLPSLDEMQMMLRQEKPVGELARLLQNWGAGIVGFKMGDQGLYVNWGGRELTAPCFQVDVVGTTGSGDCTIAGFLAGFVQGLPPEEVMTMAVAAGACCCEAPDAVSGVRSWPEIRQRIDAGWPRLPSRLEG